MKKILKWVLPLLLAVGLIASAAWYMLVYDPATVQDFLISRARRCAEKGNFNGAAWFYDLSYDLSGEDQNVAIELAEIYKSVGNYTKAEYTLANAIADGGNSELYMALCRTYVEQDKLLDAVTMLDNISDPAIKAELDQMRPSAPTADYEPGYYSQYITLTFQYEDGELYLTTDGQYPSTQTSHYTGPITLPGGESKIYAVTVADNGLVSPVAILNYTIGGVIEEVTLTDPAIDAQLRQTLLFGEDTAIYTSDLWTITEFTVPEDAVSLEDLSYLIYLEKLTISDRSIDDLSFLSDMTQLQELTLENCSIGDSLSILSTLSSLRKLTITGCGLSSIADLENARNLTELNLANNAIGNLSALANMAKLESLDLSNNAVTDLSVLANLPQLSKLDLAHNAVTSIAPLASCANLTELDVSYNSLMDISAVDNLSQLRVFSAAHNALISVDALASCTELTELNVSNNTLTDLSALAGLTKLTHLDFSYNTVTVMPSLPKDCALLVVNGEHNALTDISALGGMLNLNYVYMDYNDFSDISFLANCPQLIQVNVYATNVSSDSANALISHSIIVNFDPT